MADDTRKDPSGQFNFLVEIDGVGTFEFSEVSGLTTDTETGPVPIRAVQPTYSKTTPGWGGKGGRKADYSIRASDRSRWNP